MTALPTLTRTLLKTAAPFSVGVLLLFAGCRRAPTEKITTIKDKPAPQNRLSFLTPQAVGDPVTGHPWIAQVTAVDLDKDGLMDILVCSARENRISWIRQVSPGKFKEITLASNIPAPVHVEPVDIDKDGDLDLLVASMGQIFPDNDKIGQVIILENDGHEHFTKHVIADHIERVTDVRAADFNHDGKLDLAVGQFGYDQGKIQWMENMGNWHFKSHDLLHLSGTINVVAKDMNGDGSPDITAIVSQQWEEVYLFENDGHGHFKKKVLWGSTNQDYASSGLTVCDLNHDGRPDVLFSNGDGFGPVGMPGPRPWHGVQWLENLGNFKFKFHRIGDLAGAYSPVGVDLDGDGNMDVVAVSGFNEWNKPDAVSMMWFRNDGHMNFTPYVLAYTPTHLLTICAADIDGNGKPAIISGGFHAYPPYTHMSRVTVWRRTGKP